MDTSRHDGENYQVYLIPAISVDLAIIMLPPTVNIHLHDSRIPDVCPGAFSSSYSLLDSSQSQHGRDTVYIDHGR